MIEWLVKVLGWINVVLCYITVGMHLKEGDRVGVIFNMVYGLLWMLALLL